MLSFFWSGSYRRRLDRREIDRLREKYGDEAKDIVRARAQDPELSERDRKHWRRIARQI